MLQNGDTLALPSAMRNLSGKFVTLFCTLLLAGHALSPSVAQAQEDPFSAPLKSLNKIEPANVIQFKVVKITTNGNSSVAELDVDARGGFKVYDKGLKFEYRSGATLNAPLLLQAKAQPEAKVVQDPFYNEPRAVHDKGVRFTLTSDIPMDETGLIRVRFEACSVNTCLLPSHFLIQAAAGRTSRPEPKENVLLNSGSGQGIGASVSGSGQSTSAGAAGLGGGQALKTDSSVTKPAFSPAPALSPAPVASMRTQDVVDVSLTDSLTGNVQRFLTTRSWLLFPALFLAGLLMNLTPCVYPMIPITLNVLSRSGRQSESTANSNSSANNHNATPVLMYVLGIILSYAAMGVVAGMTGSLFGSLLQSKLVNAALAGLMFLLGLSMLDVFNLSRIQAAANRIPLSRKSPHLAVLTMGAVSGLVAAPCTGPVLSMLLLLVGQTKDPLYGFVLMSIFAAGFGAPYLVLGLLSQQIRRLPKAGNTMNAVKHIFAALMFSLALYYLKPLIQGAGYLSLVYVQPPLTGVLTISGLTLIFAVLLLRRPDSPISKIGLQIGLTILALWVALSAIKGFVLPEKTSLPSFVRINDPIDIPPQTNKTGESVQWMKNWKEAEQAAVLQKKGLIVDAWAQWCAACLKMDAEVWNESGVEALINQHFIALKIDFTESNPQSEELTKKWDLSGLPAVGIYPAGSDFSGQPAILFREAVTVSSFHQAVQKVFNGEVIKK
jgi:thiol:disulfide interchange protein DsbD